MHDAAMKSMMRMIMTKTMMQHQPKWCTCIWSWSVWTQPARPGVCHRQREGPVMLQIPVKFVLPQEWNFPLHTIINFDVDQWILDTYSNKKMETNRKTRKRKNLFTPCHGLSFQMSRPLQASRPRTHRPKCSHHRCHRPADPPSGSWSPGRRTRIPHAQCSNLKMLVASRLK